jgi:thioesterase domain-containing protein
LPSYYVVLEALPLTPNGKVNRRALPVPVHGLSGTGNGSTFVAPYTRLQQDLVTLWEDLLHIPHIGIHDNFFALGGHSLLAVQVINWINIHFGVSFSVNILFQAQTIAQMEEQLQQYTVGQPGASLIVSLRAEGNKPPFFCVHPVSGNLYNYLQLTRYLDTEQPFYGIQAQGVADEQDPLTGIEEMATTYVHALLAFQPQGPYLLGGHSMGGLIAFEMARQLEVMGKEVAQLILLDSILASHEEIEQARLITFNEIDVSTGLLEVVKYAFSDLHITVDAHFAQRPLEEQQRYILEHLKAAQALPQEMDLAQFQRQLRIFQANAYSQRMYRPQGIYHGKVTLLYCQHGNDDPRVRWRPFVQGEWETQVVPGNHYSILNEPFVRTVAEYMQSSLDQIGS